MVSIGEIDSTVFFVYQSFYTNIVGSYVSRAANNAGAKYTQSRKSSEKSQVSSFFFFVLFSVAFRFLPQI